MIIEDYVSFETAKLLKEKGFNYPCRVVYSPKGIVKHYLKEEVYTHHLKGHKKLCPTLQMAMKWLREVHKILILVEYDYPVFSSDIYKMDDIDEYGSARHIPPTFANCKDYEQACEVAIKYCLENLI